MNFFGQVMDFQPIEYIDGRVGIYLRTDPRYHGPRFVVKRLSSNLRSWNLCDIIRQNSPRVETLECAYISLEFGTPERLGEVELLVRRVLALQLQASYPTQSQEIVANPGPLPGQTGWTEPPPQLPELDFEGHQTARFAAELAGN